MATEIGIATSGKCAGYLVEQIINQISKPITLVYNWSNNVRNLKDKLALLTDKRESVQHDVDDAEKKAEEIEKEVMNWMSKADNYITGEAKKSWDELEDKAKKRCFIGLCLNPKSLYKLSKKAEEDALAVGQLLEAQFNRISFFPVDKQKAAPVDVFKNFDSRRHVLKEIMEALQTPSINKIGVYGMPGVGKTMLAGEVKRKAEQEKLFDAVVLAKVTKNPDLKSIQQEIQRGLALELPDGITEWGAAARIKATLIKKKKVLVILDDVWAPGVALEDVGIPLSANEQNQPVGERNDENSAEKQILVCKVLLTSRDLNVLLVDMGTEKEFLVGQLEDNESWELFKKIVGKGAERHELQQIGREIAKECGGLPIAVSTIGNALKNKSVHDWKDALLELKRPSPDGKSAKLFSAIEFSFKNLERDELKQTFLMCSLLSHNASIEELVKYGVGLGLFLNVRTIEETRNRVLSLVDHLKASSLLLDGRSKMYLDMHDLIRDVAKSIASRNYGVFTSRDEDVQQGWPDKEIMETLKWIYLSNGDACSGLLPDKFKCPQLTLFHLSNNSLAIPTNFFSGIEKLRVLGLTEMNLSPMPPSITLLTDLRTLRLDQSVLGEGDIGAIVGKLKNLQVLSLAGCEIEELPKEVGSLTELKLLDLSDCTKLKVIPQQVLANLSKLEELKMGNSFYQWDVEEQGKQRNASLAELTQLPKLTALELCIHDVQMIPGKLERYKIFIGDAWNNWDSSFDSSKVLKLQMKAHISFHYSIKQLLKMTEELHLEELNCVKNVVDELDIEGFPHLKYLYVRNAPELQQVVNLRGRGPFCAFPNLEVLFLRNLIKLEKLFQGRFKDTAFSKLRTITIECCHQLKSLFSSSIVSQLLQLQEIIVSDCSNMEEIIDDIKEQRSIEDTVEASEVVRPKFGQLLQSLRLQHLPKLISFNNNCSTMPLFNDQFLFPNLEELQLSWINVETIWIASYYVENLTKLIIHGCHDLKYLFSSTMARSLVKLRHLEIRECKTMRKVLSNENEEENLIFPKLKFLLLMQLQNLVVFYSGDSIIEFSSLKQLVVWNCPEFKGFAVRSTSTYVAAGVQPLFNEQVVFPSLEKMTISHLKNLTTIWHDKLNANSFCKLKSLVVICCEKLMTILPSDNMLASFWASLEELRIYRCGSLEAVFKVGEINGNQGSVVIDTQLKVLDIQHMPRLKHLWNKDPEGIISFQNLESVCVSCCDSLGHLFPASVGKDLLQLQTLDIRYSGLEEIVAIGGAEAAVKFEFPRVFSLCLYDLPRLKYFYPGNHSTEWPMLKKFYHFNCGKMKNTNRQGQLDFPVQQPLFSMEKIVPQLEELSLTEDDILMLCGESKFKENLFFNIKLLQIQGYFDKSTVLPIRFARGFFNLEKLVLIGCYFTKLLPSKGEQVGEQDKYVETEILSKIKILRLISFHNHGCTLSQDSLSVFQNLQTLEVWDCCGFPGLSTSKTASFHYLTTLDVRRCHSCLITLVSVPMARSLGQLEHMTIVECEDLIEVVGHEGDGIEYSVINFNKLRFLKLVCLTRLESFCSGNFIFKFPSLEKVIVERCPKLKIFNKGDLNTPQLQRVELDEEVGEWRWAGDLNATIQRMYTEKVGYAGLSTLILSDFSELIEIWHVRRPQEILDFRQLRSLELYNCSKLTYLLTPVMVFCLVQLERITVENCAMMEQVIMGDGEESRMILPLLCNIKLESCSNLISFYVGSHSLETPSLDKIIIKDCPKMVSFGVSTSSKEHEEDTSHQYFFNSKVEIPYLVLLDLLSINMRQMWHSQLTSISSFGQNLSVLDVADCGNLIYLFTSSMVKAFTQLKRLDISRCMVMEVVILIEELEEEERMCTVFPKLEVLVLKDLPQLIRFCSNGDSEGLKEEIFESQGLNAGRSQLFMQSTLGQVEATKLVFPLVTRVKLSNLQKFRSFFSQMHITEWPSLKSLVVFGCDRVHIFASEFLGIRIIQRDNQPKSWTQHPMFWISKDTFPSLEELKLEYNDNMKEIWHGQHPEEYFGKLKVVELICFPERSAFLPPFFFQSLPNLEKLVVREAFFTEVFQCEEVGVEEKPFVCGHTPLYELRLSELHELTHLWREEPQIEPIFSNLKTLELQECSRLKNLVPSTVHFNNLQTLFVSKCHGLVNLVRYSTAKGLVQLTKMSVSDCDMIVEIVACIDDEVKDGIIFKKLKYLQLYGLPRLASFCSMKCNFDFPSLEEVIVEKCPRMKIFSMGEVTTSQLEKVRFTEDKDTWGWESNLNTTIQKLFAEKVGYFGFEKLNLSEFPDLIESWNKNLEKILPFKKLKYLEVCNCSSLSYLLTTSMALGLVQLQHLKITNCAKMEQVIIGDQGDKEIFPQLNSLFIGSCSSLTCFYKGSNKLKFASLKEITVANCPVMLTFASSFPRGEEKEISINDEKESEECPNIHTQYFFGEEVEFPNLEFLRLSSINIQQIWNSLLSKISSSIQNLEQLYVEGCGNLKYLLTYSMVKIFLRLIVLEVCDCKLMEEIIVREGLTEEEKMSEILFPKLDLLLLKDLPKLKRFCSRNFFEFSYLTQLYIYKCPLLRTFIHSSIIEDMTTGSKMAEDTCIPPLFDAKVTFPKLERLMIQLVESLDKIWDDQHDAYSCCQLNYLCVDSCEKLLNIFPFCMLERLQRLEELHIWNCDSLEAIFESQRLDTSQLQAQETTQLTLEYATKFVFPNLTQLSLHRLPKLKGFILQMHIIEWPSLKRIWVFGCDQVQIFALESPSFRRTKEDDQQLEIEIKCSLFWASMDSLPCLEELNLGWNNSMNEIWCGQNPWDYFPKLKDLQLIHFEELSSLLPSFFFQSLPSLERLVVSEASFHEIFQCERLNSEERPIDVPSRLRELSLSKLHELMHLWNEESDANRFSST